MNEGRNRLSVAAGRGSTYGALEQGHPENAMAGGWAKDGAVQEQIDASVDDAVQRVRSHLSRGEGLEACEACGDVIRAARREAVPGVRRCLPCQAMLDGEQTFSDPINRRGSKDSQLR